MAAREKVPLSTTAENSDGIAPTNAAISCLDPASTGRGEKEEATAIKEKPEARAPKSSRPEVVSAIIGIIPSIAAILALVIILLVYRDDIRRMLPRVSGVEAFGVKLSLIDLQSWAADREYNLRKISTSSDLRITSHDLKNALDRAASARAAYQDARLLWVDDHPENNIWERRAFTALGTEVTVVLSNAEAEDRLRRADFDVLISDLSRDSGEDARALPKNLQGRKHPPTVIYYVLRKRDELRVPEEAFGITNRPDDLVNLVTDVLDRRLYRSPNR